MNWAKVGIYNVMLLRKQNAHKKNEYQKFINFLFQREKIAKIKEETEKEKRKQEAEKKKLEEVKKERLKELLRYAKKI